MEKYVLSAMLLQDGIAIPKAAAILSSDDFFYPEHQIIFSTMMQLYSQGTVPDILLIAEELRKSDMLQKIGGMTYLLTLSEWTFTTAFIESHAKIVKEKAILPCLSNHH